MKDNKEIPEIIQTRVSRYDDVLGERYMITTRLDGTSYKTSWIGSRIEALQEHYKFLNRTMGEKSIEATLQKNS